jgi:hypothetical protein
MAWTCLVGLFFAVPITSAFLFCAGVAFSPFWAMRKWTPRLYEGLADIFAEPGEPA